MAFLLKKPTHLLHNSTVSKYCGQCGRGRVGLNSRELVELGGILCGRGFPCQQREGYYAPKIFIQHSPQQQPKISSHSFSFAWKSVIASRASSFTRPLPLFCLPFPPSPLFSSPTSITCHDNLPENRGERRRFSFSTPLSFLLSPPSTYFPL